MNADKLKSLTDALNYIEDNLDKEVTREDCATAACCSLSGLNKLFSYTFHISVGDYITRRKLSAAAKDLREDELSVLEIGLKYGYGSAEAFTRAFTRLWGTTPSEYRRNRSFSALYPKLDFPRYVDYRGETIMINKFDITELYDYLSDKRGCYAISFDTSRLMEINEKYGSAAGDKVICESIRRIDEAAGEGMAAFRIGGDEYVLITGYTDKQQAEQLAMSVLKQNGDTVEHNGVQIPVLLRAGLVRIGSGAVKYNELFTSLAGAPSPDPDVLNTEQ